jgi:hypothetical protein
MPISNYTELKTTVEAYAKRGDIGQTMDIFIDLCEADLSERVRVRDMEARAIATASTADRFLALPTGFLKMRKIRLYTGSVQYDLNYRVPESLNVITSAGIPTDYTITSQLEFNRIPSSAYTVEMQYYRSLDALSATNATNEILTRFPKLYLYGVLFHFAQWAQDDGMIQKYSVLFDGAIDAVNRSEVKGRHGPAKAMRIEGSTP